MYLNIIFISISLLNLYACMQAIDTNVTDASTGSKNVILSRRKRFIVFPEGSSFQLVFCTTYPMIFAIGDIFLWGNTAALAWELPQDPYSPFNHKADPLHRRMDSKVIYYTDEDGRVINKRPYERKFIVNPAFAKRSIDSSEQIKKASGTFEIDRKQMHRSQNNVELSKHNWGRRSIQFHRSSRASLYQKIETMLQGLGGNGKQCMLKTLCIVGKSKHLPQGSFLQEILRAVFALPKGTGSLAEDDKLKDYDEAHTTAESCDELYPDCNDPLSDESYPIINQ